MAFTAGLEEAFPDKLRLLGQMEENLYTCLSSFTHAKLGVSPPTRPRDMASRRIAVFVTGSTRQPLGVAGTLFPPLSVLSGFQLDDLGTAIETWEEKIKAYESRRGP